MQLHAAWRTWHAGDESAHQSWDGKSIELTKSVCFCVCFDVTSITMSHGEPETDRGSPLGIWGFERCEIVDTNEIV